MINKIVIPAAGLGSRLLPITKEIPKEMMPLFLKDRSGKIIVKPLIQILFEKFYGYGFREFCIIVGRQKRSIEDYFSPDYDLLTTLNARDFAKKDLENFYSMLNNSSIFWTNQQKQKGFGDAVLYSESFVGNEEFLLSAGDTLIPNNDKIFQKLIKIKLKGDNDAVLLLKEVPDPKRFGVAVIKNTKNGTIITNVEEKPARPKSNFSIVALYRFKPSIFKALHKVKSNKKELQLTEGIQKLIECGGKIHAIIMNKDDIVIDIGTSSSYLENFLKLNQS